MSEEPQTLTSPLSSCSVVDNRAALTCLDEIKSIYGRLKEEYDYLKKRQGVDHDHVSDRVARLPKKEGAVVVDVDEMPPAAPVAENTQLRYELERLQGELAERTREYKRVKAGFDQLQADHKLVKLEAGKLAEERDKLNARCRSLSARLDNLLLQAKNNPKKPCLECRSAPSGREKNKKPSETLVAGGPDECPERLLTLALETLSELSTDAVGGGSSKQFGSSSATAARRSDPSATSKPSTNCRTSGVVLFNVAELLRNMPPSLASQSRFVDPLLRLLYDALPSPAGNQQGCGDLRPGVLLLLEKCGEHLFRPPIKHSSGGLSSSSEPSADDDVAVNKKSSPRPPSHSAALYFRSSQLPTRFLSTAIILRTVSRGTSPMLSCFFLSQRAESYCFLGSRHFGTGSRQPVPRLFD